MSFTVGKFYKCVIGGTNLTHGKYYECISYIPSSPAGAMYGLRGDVNIRDDAGRYSFWGEHRFDQSTETSSPPAQAGSKPPRSPDICSCGTKAEKKVFATFEYYYCRTCKKEVGGKANEVKEKAVIDPAGRIDWDALNLAIADLPDLNILSPKKSST